MNKARRIDYYPDEFLAGVAGRLTMAEGNVYWLVCTLIYSHGEPVDDDPKWIARLIDGANARGVEHALSGLESKGKVTRTGGKLSVNRCLKELEKTTERIGKNGENGAKGGRPPKQINEVAKPDGLPDENPTRASTTNQQPATSNQVEESPSIPQRSVEAEFVEFWTLYPRREGRKDALKAYKAARGRADAAAILDGARRAAERYGGKDQQYTPMGATWLRGDRWLDEEGPKPDGKSPDDHEARAKRAADRLRAPLAAAGLARGLEPDGSGACALDGGEDGFGGRDEGFGAGDETGPHGAIGADYEALADP